MVFRKALGTATLLVVPWLLGMVACGQTNRDFGTLSGGGAGDAGTLQNTAGTAAAGHGGANVARVALALAVETQVQSAMLARLA